MKDIAVECHAGSRPEEYPVRFYLGRRKIEIAAIYKRWLTPESRNFRVLGDDGCLYDLEYENSTGTWKLLTVNRQ